MALPLGQTYIFLRLTVAVLMIFYIRFNSNRFITGPPTQCRGQYCFARCRLSSSVTLHGGPVSLRPVRATPCYRRHWRQHIVVYFSDALYYNVAVKGLMMCLTLIVKVYIVWRWRTHRLSNVSRLQTSQMLHKPAHWIVSIQLSCLIVEQRTKLFSWFRLSVPQSLTAYLRAA